MTNSESHHEIIKEYNMWFPFREIALSKYRTIEKVSFRKLKVGEANHQRK